MIQVATLTFTFAAGSEGGAALRSIANAIERASMAVPDRNSSGPALTCVLDNSPSSGVVSVQVAGAGLPTQPAVIG